MARKRMISPDIWQSEDFSELSTLGKVVFIGLFSNADDDGRGRRNASYIKSILFPYDVNIRVTDIENALSEISQHMSITYYDCDEKPYYSLDNWHAWQKIEKPTPSKLPAPPDVKKETPRTLPEHSPNTPREVEPNRIEENKNGIEKEEKEKEEAEDNASGLFTPPNFSDVESYCKERKSNIDPQTFIDFYTSKGWKVGNQPMEDWKAALRTWEKREERQETARAAPVGKKLHISAPCTQTHKQQGYGEEYIKGLYEN